MQHDTSDNLFSLFKMTLEGISLSNKFSFILKIKKKIFFVTNSNKIHIFSFSSISRLKQDATRYV